METEDYIQLIDVQRMVPESETAGGTRSWGTWSVYCQYE